MAALVGMHAKGTSSEIVQAKLDEFFWEWLCLPESQKIVRQAIQKGTDAQATQAPSPSFSNFKGSRPSPPGSPHSRSLLRDSHLQVSDSGSGSEAGWSSSGPSAPSSPSQQCRAEKEAARGQPVKASGSAPAARPSEPLDATLVAPSTDARPSSGTDAAPGTSTVIPRFWWPKRQKPVEQLPPEMRQQIRDQFSSQGITDIRLSSHLEPFVTEIFGLSKYFVVPIFHKLKVFFDIVDEASFKTTMLAPSPVPITEQMLVSWASGRIQAGDPVLSFFWVVKKDHNNWIEREDFNIFLQAILMTHPGLDFLRVTREFQDRYADTVISRIFFVYDLKDTGRIYLTSLRRYQPSVIETWKQLADNDDIKMVRDYFSYEHFYVIYCTFWELDADHDFLLDKDDLLKYDGHTLSRRAVDRIFNEIPTKFTSAVKGKMGYDDFIRFLLCDQDRQTSRSVEYWFQLFDLDGDGCIRDHEMKYFYEEQAQRMECLNYETISFADIMCQMNDMIWPRQEGFFRLQDFKRRRKLAGTFFSLFSSLNKFLNFEHRDPFLSKQEQLDNPNFTDWDRWCADEYLRLAMEEGEENDDGGT